MNTVFPITVDATALSNTAYLISGPLTGVNVFPGNSPSAIGWTENTQAYTVEMVEGDFLFQIESGGVDSFHFQVQGDGTITYADDYAPFLSGAGTSKLIVKGYEVQIDARYITTEVFWSANLSFPPVPITLNTYFLIPLGGYKVSPIEENDWGFGVDGSGKFQYPKAFDYNPTFPTYSQTGFLQGMGTTTLTILGYPLLVDARNTGGSGLRVDPGNGVPFAASGVAYVNMLPEYTYALEFEDGVPSLATFSVTDAGEITLHQELPWELSLDHFHGVPRLTVKRAVFLKRPLEVEEPTEQFVSKA